jgi:signal transduction histidine kinase
MILIVDDKEENLFSLKALLQLHSYEVDMASSGELALKKLLKNDYALIILDVQMPEMDGFEVAEAVTGLNKTKDIPIIFLTAVNIDKRFISMGYASGGVDYVTKPFDPDLLLLKVKTFTRLYEQHCNLKHIQQALQTEIGIRKKAQDELVQVNLSLEEKVAERTKSLVVLNNGLESRNAELAQYVSLASHDLQEPLRKVITFSRILDEKYLHDIPAARRDMDKIIASCERMRNLINDFLNYSILSADLVFSTVDLNEIVANTLDDLEVAIADKNAIIDIDNLATVEGNPGQLRQLFQNIIGNSLKFSKKESAPSIKIWNEFIGQKDAEAPALTEGAFVRIFVQDSGIGFDQQYDHKIFTMFQRLHGRSEYEGTGIGLALVKKIVEKHQGLVVAKSKENEGATIIIILPVHQQGNEQINHNIF